MKFKGYMSIEAALIFPIVMMGVLLMMGLSIYVCDRIVIKECIYDALLLGAREETDSRETVMKERITTLLEERGIALGVENITVKDELTRVKIRVDAKVNLAWIVKTDLPIHEEEDLVKLDVIKLKRLGKIGEEVFK